MEGIIISTINLKHSIKTDETMGYNSKIHSMKKIYCMIVLSIVSMSLLAQENVDATNANATIQIESSGSAGGKFDFNKFDKDQKHENIVKTEEGYFFYLYDYGCKAIEIFEEKYWIKLFLGKTIDDVLKSGEMINKWYKQAKSKSYIVVTNPDGQKITLFKNVAPSLFLSYGTIEDIKWANESMNTDANNTLTGLVPFAGILNARSAQEDRERRDTYIKDKIADGTYQLTMNVDKNTFMRKIKKLSKQNE